MSNINVNRQSKLTAHRDFEFSDFTSGTASVMIYTRPGTRVLGGWVDITEPFNASGTVTFTVGDTEANDVDRYLTSTDAKTAGLTPLAAPVSNGVIATAEAVTMTLTVSAGTNTAGAGRIFIEFVEEPRTTEFYPYRG